MRLHVSKHMGKAPPRKHKARAVSNRPINVLLSGHDTEDKHQKRLQRHPACPMEKILKKILWWQLSSSFLPKGRKVNLSTRVFNLPSRASIPTLQETFNMEGTSLTLTPSFAIHSYKFSRGLSEWMPSPVDQELQACMQHYCHCSSFWNHFWTFSGRLS